ncbi:unnamed protein product [Caenorhabditis nigoni]
MSSKNPSCSSEDTSNGPDDEIYYDDEVPEEKQWLEYVRKNPGAKYKPLTLEHFFTQAKIIAEQMGTGWYTFGREDSDEEQPESRRPDLKKGPTRKLEFEEWKEKVLKNQESSGPEGIQTIPKECLAINKPNEFTNFVNFQILNTSKTLITYSAKFKNPFLEVVDNSEGAVEAGSSKLLQILCKFDCGAPIGDELLLQFEDSEKCWTRSFPIYYDTEFWS